MGYIGVITHLLTFYLLTSCNIQALTIPQKKVTKTQNCQKKCDWKSLRIQVCPKKGIIPTFLF